MLLGVTFAGISIDEYTVTKPVYKPGEPGVVTISVSNPTGSERVSSITMDINSPYEITVTSAPNLADIDSGGSAIVSIPFKVKDGTKPGIYSINVFFRGTKSGDTAGTTVTSVNSVSVPITVVNEPELSFSVDTKVLTGLDDVTLTITNNGGVANNLRVAPGSGKTVCTIKNAEPDVSTCTTLPPIISLHATDQVYVGTVVDSISVPLSLDSRSAEDGAEDIGLVVTYEDALGISHTEEVNLRVTVRNEQLDIAIVQPNGLSTRAQTTLMLQVTNDGTETISDLRIKFLGDSLKLIDATELKFGNLAPGQTGTASATIYTEMQPGINLVDSRVEWIEKDVQMEEDRSIALAVTSDADVEVFLEAKPLPLTSGGEHTISVLVSNLGTFSIENVDVAIESPALRSLDISNKQYIGGLQRDDFSTVQFLVQVNSTGPGTYPVYLDINYRDQSGEWKQKTIKKEINVYNGVSDEGGDPVPLLVGLGIVAVLVWYFKFRKK